MLNACCIFIPNMSLSHVVLYASACLMQLLHYSCHSHVIELTVNVSCRGYILLYNRICLLIHYQRISTCFPCLSVVHVGVSCVSVVSSYWYTCCVSVIQVHISFRGQVGTVWCTLMACHHVNIISMFICLYMCTYSYCCTVCLCVLICTVCVCILFVHRLWLMHLFVSWYLQLVSQGIIQYHVVSCSVSVVLVAASASRAFRSIPVFLCVYI